MSGASRNRGAQPTPEETAVVEVLRTGDLLARGLAPVLKREKLSTAQYNVLRILRGAPEGLACGEIASRMITRDPDITRLLDRLEKRGLIARRRESRDRRLVVTRIAAAGLEALARLDGPVREAHGRQLGHVGRARLAELAELLRMCREDGG